MVLTRRACHGLILREANDADMWTIIDHLQKDAKKRGVLEGKNISGTFWRCITKMNQFNVMVFVHTATGEVVGYTEMMDRKRRPEDKNECSILSGYGVPVYIETFEMMRRKRGYGRQSVQLLKKLAVPGLSFRLNPTMNTEGFWHKMGFRPYEHPLPHPSCYGNWFMQMDDS